jgi:putative PIN family toxin of toxin-antitoxin system
VIRAVIDTNILVSGLLSPNGNEAMILLAVRQGLVRPCLSEDIIAEYAGVLARPKFAFAPSLIASLLGVFRENGEMFQPEGFMTTSPDPADTKLLHCAEAAAAEFIVTGNKRHFPDAPYGKIRVVNAGELLDRITVEL